MTLSLIKENISYTEEGNIFHFFPITKAALSGQRRLTAILQVLICK